MKDIELVDAFKDGECIQDLSVRYELPTHAIEMPIRHRLNELEGIKAELLNCLRDIRDWMIIGSDQLEAKSMKKKAAIYLHEYAGDEIPK